MWEREYQLGLRAAKDPRLERDPATGIPLSSSESNRVWLRDAIDDLSDLESNESRHLRQRQRAVEYLRRHLSLEVVEDQMLLFAALLYSRGVPRVLKSLQRVGLGEDSFVLFDVFVPRDVQVLWLQMATFIANTSNPSVQRKLGEAVRSVTSLSNINPRDLSALEISIPEFFATIPDARATFPDEATLSDWIDRGLVCWDKARATISFATFADFAITQASSEFQPDRFRLLSLLFNESGKEHEVLAVQSLREAALNRLHTPGVRAVLHRLGLVAEQSSGSLASGVELLVKWENHPVPFPNVNVVKLRVNRIPVPSFDESVKLGTNMDRVRTQAASVADARFRPRVSLPTLLMEGATKSCRAVINAHVSRTGACNYAGLQRDAGRLFHIDPSTAEGGNESLLFDFATIPQDSVARTIHDALEIDELSRSLPVLIKPYTDRIVADWILVQPDESLTLIQMKHGESAIDERETLVDVAAGVKVLRALLGHRGVANWATTPIQGVVWSLRPTAESQWATNSIPEGNIAKAIGVSWLTKADLAPIWTAEVVRALFFFNKEVQWGVVNEKERARVTKSFAQLFRRAGSTHRQRPADGDDE